MSEATSAVGMTLERGEDTLAGWHEDRPGFKAWPSSAQAILDPMRIVVVEDEPDLRRFLTTGLEAEGWAVIPVADGPQACALRSPRTSTAWCLISCCRARGRGGTQAHPVVPPLVARHRPDGP